MVKTPYLIQRATIHHPRREGRFSEAVSLDYMGSAEFEWGALPQSLRELQARVDDIKVTIEPRITGDNGESLRVLHTFTDEEYEEYFGHLMKLREGKGHTKENTYFDKDHSKRFKTLRCDLWWDLDNSVMFTFDKVFMKRLPDHLVVSWKYMDEQKVK